MSNIFSQLLAFIPPILLGYGFRSTPATTSCRCFPSEPCWPSPAEWNAFNETIGGKLIATVPLAAPCHDSAFGPYDEEACNALRDVWFFPETHIPSASSPMAQVFANNSCNPFSPPDAPCLIGTAPRYAVDAQDAADFQKTLEFVNRHNIRLVIRNSGHDYLGRSTGAGSLAIWTQHMKSMEMLPEYKSTGYTGLAIKMGAGVSALEAYEFANSNGVAVVGGNCPTVSIAGGYTQGGGLGPLSSKFGLAVDQVLEWEVVTADGKLLTATPEQNSDLFWALNGGGGGTFGVVVSLTAKAHPSVEISTAQLMVGKTEENEEAFWDVVTTFHNSLPAMVDAGAVVTFAVVPNAFVVTPAVAPNMTPAQLDAFMQPTRDKLDKHGIPYQYIPQHFPTFLEYYQTMSLRPANVSDFLMGGRLIPRSLVEPDPTTGVQSRTSELVSAIRKIVSHGDTVYSGVSFNVAKSVSSLSTVSANPYWRESLYSAVFGAAYHYDDWDANLRTQVRMTEELVPALSRLTKSTANGDGAYLNEADFREKEFKQLFYGENYARLDQVKRKYDPEGVFYGIVGVGSDRWEEKSDGRLCKVSN